MMSPLIEQFATEYAGKVKIGKVNVDEERALAMKFGIQSIPCFVFIKDGKVTDTVVGAMPKEALNRRLEKLAA